MWFYFHIDKFVSIKSLILLEGSSSKFDQYDIFSREEEEGIKTVVHYLIFSSLHV